MTPDPAETLKLLPESTPVLRFVYISADNLLTRVTTRIDEVCWDVEKDLKKRNQNHA